METNGNGNGLRQAFCAAVERRDAKAVKLTRHDLGIDIYCRLLRAKEQSQFSARWSDQESGVKENYAAEYLAICLADETGRRLFPGELEVNDLAAMPAVVLLPILEECQEINGVKEDHRKNSAATGADSSSSNSPVTSSEPSKS